MNAVRLRKRTGVIRRRRCTQQKNAPLARATLHDLKHVL